MSNLGGTGNSPDDRYITREELLSGLPARRASTLLFAIENRTAYLRKQSQQVGARFRIGIQEGEESERAFLEALSQGRSSPAPVTIQDLERYAADWSSLVPNQDDAIRAAVARLLSEKNLFTHRHTPRLRAALGMDTDGVKDAYQTFYRQPLELIYTDHVSLVEQAKWTWSRVAYALENLPPFWAVFALTLTETVGASILALPIALAGVGPIPGVVLLIVLGLANIFTIMAIVEAITRNGTMRYGNTYFGTLVGDYLGRAGTLTFTLSLVVLIFFLLTSYYVGISSTLQQLTGLPNMLWAALVFLAGFYFVSRNSLNATIASAIIIGAINIGAILVISLLSLPHIKGENLSFAGPWLTQGAVFNVSILQLILGVIMGAYFGHTSAANVAKIVLRKDPSGRALMSGSIMAQVAAISVYCIWILAINGSVDHETLRHSTDTALTAITGVLGPVALGLGTIYVILGMGLGSIHFSIGLYNIVHELLPDRLFRTARQRFWLAVSPLFVCALLIEYLLYTKQESFTAPISFVGVIIMPILAGIFPILMLFSSRKKGNYLPGVVFRSLGSVPIGVGLFLFFLASIFLHGAVIWENPVQRITALVVSLIVVGLTYIFIRNRAFAPRAVVEIFLDQSTGKPAVLNLLHAGKPLTAQVTLSYGEEKQHLNTASSELPGFSRLQSLQVELPAAAAKELEIWMHQLSKDGLSEPMSALIRISASGAIKELDLTNGQGRHLVPYPEGDATLEVRLTGDTRLT